MHGECLVHTPVLLQEVLDGLPVRSDGIYIDATAGEGGHLKEIAKRAKKVLALEVSAEQLEWTKKNVEENNIVYMNTNFADLENVAKEKGFEYVDGILFDLGLSFWEIEHLKKGLSFEKGNEPLDMRLSDTGESAMDVLNTASEDELYGVFSDNSEEVHSRAIAEKMVQSRKNRKLEHVGDLTDLIDSVIGHKDRRVYARIFQALRMQVNHEITNLKKGLEGAAQLLKPGGRLAVISFHSVEDRVVKRHMAQHNLKLVVKKTPSFGDRRFERSATLRIGEKIS